MKNFKFKSFLCLFITSLFLFSLTGCQTLEESSTADSSSKIIEVIDATSKNDSTEADSSEIVTTEPETQEQTTTASPTEPPTEAQTEPKIDENGTYTSKEDVALYIHTYNKLPQNFITKKEAEKLGWEGGSLEPYAKGKCIGGSHFGNYEGILPEKDGRKYTECDIDTLGAKKRGAKRIVFSNDGLIYYTDDHYETFELLYGNEE